MKFWFLSSGYFNPSEIFACTILQAQGMLHKEETQVAHAGSWTKGCGRINPQVLNMAENDRFLKRTLVCISVLEKWCNLIIFRSLGAL